MKKALLWLAVAGLGVALLSLGSRRHGEPGGMPSASPSACGIPMATAAPMRPVATAAPASRLPVVVPNVGPQLSAARDAALKANPDLAAEAKQLARQVQAQQDNFEEAMVRADSKVAALVDRLDAMRQRSRAPAAATAHPGAASALARREMITPEEWQRLGAARTATLRAHPELAAANEKLMDKMRAFQEKLDAAMARANPALTASLGQFEVAAPTPSGAPAGSIPAAPPTGK